MKATTNKFKWIHNSWTWWPIYFISYPFQLVIVVCTMCIFGILCVVCCVGPHNMLLLSLCAFRGDIRVFNVVHNFYTYILHYVMRLMDLVGRHMPCHCRCIKCNYTNAIHVFWVVETGTHEIYIREIVHNFHLESIAECTKTQIKLPSIADEVA